MRRCVGEGRPQECIQVSYHRWWYKKWSEKPPTSVVHPLWIKYQDDLILDNILLHKTHSARLHASEWYMHYMQANNSRLWCPILSLLELSVCWVRACSIIPASYSMPSVRVRSKCRGSITYRHTYIFMYVQQYTNGCWAAISSNKSYAFNIAYHSTIYASRMLVWCSSAEPGCMQFYLHWAIAVSI